VDGTRPKFSAQVGLTEGRFRQKEFAPILAAFSHTYAIHGSMQVVAANGSSIPLAIFCTMHFADGRTNRQTMLREKAVGMRLERCRLTINSTATRT